MKKVRLILPVLSGLVLTSMAYGQNISVITPAGNKQVKFISDEDPKGTASRLMAYSNYRFNLGAYDPTDSIRLHHAAGQSSAAWGASNPYGVTNVEAFNQWESAKNIYFGPATYRNLDTLLNYFWSPSLMNWSLEEKVQLTDKVGDTAVAIARTQTINNASIMEYSRRYYEYYNPNGTLETVMFENWDGSAWAPDYRISLFPAEGGKDSAMVRFAPLGSGWEPASKRTVTYNQDERVAEVTDHDYVASGWTATNRYAYTYNAAGQILSELTQASVNDTAWEDSRQVNYTYNSAGKRIQLEVSRFDGTQWLEETKYIYDYNAEGLLSSRINQYHNGTSYVNDSKTEYHYDGEMLSHYDNFSWDGGNQEWIASTRTNIENNIENNEGTIVQWQQSWNAGNFLELVNGNMKETFYFESYTPTSIKMFDKSQVTVYPNPASGDLNIKVADARIQTIQIYSITGALVMNVKNVQQGDTKIDISALQSGLYNVLVQTNKGTGSYKLSVVK